MVWATRTVTPQLPDETGRVDGLAYSLWRPPAPKAGIVVLHGAGSAKESHHDFAREALALGLATICFDARGHGESDGPMGAQPLDDVVRMAALLRARLGDERAPLALRGSSMGGYLAILSAGPARAQAVVAICPASAAGLRRGLAAGRFPFAADAEALDAFLAEHELEPAVAALTAPLLLLHAEGDEQVPIQHSRELAQAVTAPGSRLIAVPGGHHRSIQHDAELQAVSLRFIEQALGLRPRRANGRT
jgi:alpha-beta hydrolase superfamily lysophospholipase